MKITQIKNRQAARRAYALWQKEYDTKNQELKLEKKGRRMLSICTDDNTLVGYACIENAMFILEDLKQTPGGNVAALKGYTNLFSIYISPLYRGAGLAREAIKQLVENDLISSCCFSNFGKMKELYPLIDGTGLDHVVKNSESWLPAMASVAYSKKGCLAHKRLLEVYGPVTMYDLNKNDSKAMIDKLAQNFADFPEAKLEWLE